jgi:hypothetical protein
MIEPRLKAGPRLCLLPKGLSFPWQARPKADARASMPARRSLRATSRIPTSKQADQRAEAINCATPYPPRMTAAKLPATTARRKAVVMAYSMGSPQIKSAPSRAKKVGGKIRPHQVQPGMTLDMPL